jgi:hypothetical protein
MVRIVTSAYRAMRGELALPEQAGMCLKLVRVIVEDAFGMQPWSWYSQWLTDDRRVQRAPGDDYEPWARDMERALRDARLAYSIPNEGRYVSHEKIMRTCGWGTLLFRWDTAKTKRGTFVGHVGILMPGGLVLENVNPAFRAMSLARGFTCLTPLSQFPVTTAIDYEGTQ